MSHCFVALSFDLAAAYIIPLGLNYRIENSAKYDFR
jgi:hypothetical protein